jgi:hypothetical protein
MDPLPAAFIQDEEAESSQEKDHIHIHSLTHNLIPGSKNKNRCRR